MCWSWFPIRPSISTGSSPWFFNKITSPHIESLGPRVKISKTIHIIHPVVQYLPREFFARRIKRLTCALAQKTVDGEISLQDLSQFPFWSNKNHRMKVKTESKHWFGGPQRAYLCYFKPFSCLNQFLRHVAWSSWTLSEWEPIRTTQMTPGFDGRPGFLWIKTFYLVGQNLQTNGHLLFFPSLFRSFWIVTPIVQDCCW